MTSLGGRECYPTLATKTKTSQEWGTRGLWRTRKQQKQEQPQVLRLRLKSGLAQDDKPWWAGVLSHPCDKNKDVARMGHPRIVANSQTAKARTTAGPSTPPEK